jgi:hypothetical protein
MLQLLHQTRVQENLKSLTTNNEYKANGRVVYSTDSASNKLMTSIELLYAHCFGDVFNGRVIIISPHTFSHIDKCP